MDLSRRSLMAASLGAGVSLGETTRGLAGMPRVSAESLRAVASAARQGVDAAEMGADSTGRTPSTTAINTALAQMGTDELVFSDGDFRIDGPILLSRSDQRVVIRRSAKIIVPAGYSDTVFRIGDPGRTAVRGVVVTGGGSIVSEGLTGGRQTQPGQWTFVEYVGDRYGASMCEISDLTIFWPGTFQKVSVVGQGWVNSNLTSRVRVFYPRRVLECSGEGSVQVGAASNSWDRIDVQCGNFTEYGIKNLIGRSWTFKDCYLYDVGHNPNCIGAEITAACLGIQFINGSMTLQNYINDAAPGEVTITDRFRVKPWHESVTSLGAPALDVDPSLSTAAVRTHHLAWPVIRLVDRRLSGCIGIYRVPHGVQNVRVSASLVNLSAAAGDVRLVLQSNEWSAGQPLNGLSRRAILNVSMGPKSTGTETAVGNFSGLVSGDLLRLRAYRIGAHANDTLPGDVGLIALNVQPYL